MAKPLRVGIIGASAVGGWAREGHVPAVQGPPRTLPVFMRRYAMTLPMVHQPS